MLAPISRYPFFQERHLEAPLFAERDLFLTHLESLGAGHRELSMKASYLLHIVRIMKLDRFIQQPRQKLIVRRRSGRRTRAHFALETQPVSLLATSYRWPTKRSTSSEAFGCINPRCQARYPRGDPNQRIEPGGGTFRSALSHRKSILCTNPAHRCARNLIRSGLSPHRLRPRLGLRRFS
jgi:hypothetical protein